MEKYNLQLIPGGVALVIHVSQFDTAREYLFTPMMGSTAYTYENVAVVVEATKPDNTVVQEKATYNSDGTVSYHPSDVLFQASGDVRLKFRFIDSNNQTVASATLTFAVDLAGITTYARISESDLSLLQENAAKLLAIDAAVVESQTQAARSKSWAVGPSGTGTDGTDSNNSWYWAKQSSSSASAAKTSETNAKTYETNTKTYATNAKTSETNAKTYATNAKTSETNAKTYATNAKTSETNAKTYLDETKKAAESIENYDSTAKSWAVGPSGTDTAGTDTNNAKYWASESERAATIAINNGVSKLNGETGDVVLAFSEESGDLYLESSGTAYDNTVVSLNNYGGEITVNFDKTSGEIYLIV